MACRFKNQVGVASSFLCLAGVSLGTGGPGDHPFLHTQLYYGFVGPSVTEPRPLIGSCASGPPTQAGIGRKEFVGGLGAVRLRESPGAAAVPAAAAAAAAAATSRAWVGTGLERHFPWGVPLETFRGPRLAFGLAGPRLHQKKTSKHLSEEASVEGRRNESDWLDGKAYVLCQLTVMGHTRKVPDLGLLTGVPFIPPDKQHLDSALTRLRGSSHLGRKLTAPSPGSSDSGCPEL
ncbi:uncharacterized protein LOC107402315 isoform X1 [Peromyscus maniculatus bairdii]|uniref:uncharacterized protein LOC107402315 isoform X1 n=1 Tax=Peromyscus maniculatus bairdii TaxID=230844 RepID=UPI00077D9C7E|nr:uncharacterized protein LOC107402315 [Peromyscus maniculatus bairdii]